MCITSDQESQIEFWNVLKSFAVALLIDYVENANQFTSFLFVELQPFQNFMTLSLAFHSVSFYLSVL